MKKFIFSAVAMVAFVGSSVASNEVDMVDPPTIVGCMTQAEAHMVKIRALETMTDNEYMAEYNRYFNKCYGIKQVIKDGKLTFVITPSF